MSTESELILFRKNLPLAKEIEDLILETGSVIKFESGFDFDQSPSKYVKVECDGQKEFFAYSIYLISELHNEEDFEDFSNKTKEWGDTVLSFTTHGSLAGQIVALIQKTIAKKAHAAAWIQGELIPTKDVITETISDDLPPELAATLKGSPSERAAAMDAYIASNIPKVNLTQYKKNPLKVWLNDNKIEIITVVVIVLGLIIYTLLT